MYLSLYRNFGMDDYLELVAVVLYMYCILPIQSTLGYESSNRLAA